MSVGDDRFTMITLKAVEHVAAVAGGLCLFRDLVDDMHRVAEQGVTDTGAIGGIIGGWVERFDFIGNALATSNDEQIEALQEARVASVLCTGSYVARNVLGGANAEGGA